MQGPTAPRSWYQIRRAAASAAALAAAGGKPVASSAEIWIYADIGESWWGETVTAKDLVKELAELDVDELTVRINSYGGSVTDGLAIYNALKRHRATVTVAIDGIAASIASLIAMAGDTVQMADNAQLMIHAPWGGAYGNAAQMREYADLLDRWAQAMAGSYAAKTGKDRDEVLTSWLQGDQDHWFSAEEALAEGLVDEIVDAIPVAAHASALPWQRGGGGSPPAAPAAAAQPVPVPPAPRGPNSAASAAIPQEPSMDPKNQPAAGTTPAAIQDPQAIAQAAARAEADRQSQIRDAFKAHGARIDAKAAAELEAACLADLNVTPAAAKLKILDAMAKGTEPVAGGYVATMEDEADKQRRGFRAALEIRAGLAKNEGSNPFRAYTLLEMARASLVRAGVRDRDMPGDKMGLIALAFTHSTSDFGNLLANVANKSMMMGYEEAQETFPRWTRPGSLPDFKIAQAVDLGSFPSLRQVREGAEYKMITVGDRAEPRVLATYGERVAITRQAIINDDLDAFSRLPRKLGIAAIRTVGDLVYAVLTGNPNMADGQALFSAPHNNTASAAAISTTSVDAMRVQMARQKDIGQTSGGLNIRLAYLIVPVSLQGTADTVRESQFEITASGRNQTTPNSVRNTFEVVADARLDDASTSIWYGAASPTMHDTVVVDYLDGVQTPTLEQQTGWTVDGAEFKVRIDAAAKALDWKTLARNG